MKKTYVLGLLLLSALLTACQSKPPTDAFQLTESSTESRQIQSRIFETADEAGLLAAGIGVLQDMGYTLVESEKNLGLITASKTVDARDTGQFVAAIFVAALGGGSMPLDKEQKIKVSFVTYPSRTKIGYVARASFQRIVWDNHGNISRFETLVDTSLYEDFFDKLSKSIFLEAHAL